MILLAAASHSTLNVTPAAQLIVHIQGDRTRCQEPVSAPTKTRDSARGALDFRTEFAPVGPFVQLSSRPSIQEMVPDACISPRV